MDEELEEAPKRSTAARIGLSLLNLLAPGVGLIRAGRPRAGLAFLVALFAYLLLLAVAALLLPTLTPTGFLVVVIVSAAVWLAVYPGSMVATWRNSRRKTLHLPWWRRWWALAAIIVVHQLASIQAVDLLHDFYKPFYIPAQSMAPTLAVGDRLVADMRPAKAPRPGEVILLRVGGHIYVKRVAAVGGDRIAMVGGVPVVNGKAALRRRVGAMPQPTGMEEMVADILVERLPGESGEHRILETYRSPVDDMEEITVPAGHLFVLGDNRDYSADSRVPHEEQGVEMVPLSDVSGRALFRTWTNDWRWLGSPIR